jgi:hypothetical protein
MAASGGDVRAGDLVNYEGTTCRVRRKRRVTPFAMFATAEIELLLEALDRPGWPGWVGDNEVTKVRSDSRRRT